MLASLKKRRLLWPILGLASVCAIALAVGIPIGDGRKTVLRVSPSWAYCEGTLVSAELRCPVKSVEIFADAQGRLKIDLPGLHAFSHRIVSISDPNRRERFRMERYGLRVDMPAGWLAYRFRSTSRREPDDSYEDVRLHFDLMAGDRTLLTSNIIGKSGDVVIKFTTATPYMRSDYRLRDLQLRSDYELRHLHEDPRFNTVTTTIVGLDLLALGLKIDLRPKTIDEARAGDNSGYFIPANDNYLEPDRSKLFIRCDRNEFHPSRCYWSFVIPNDRLAAEIRDRLPHGGKLPYNKNIDNHWYGYGVELSFPRSEIGRWRDIVDATVCMMELITKDVMWDASMRVQHRCEMASQWFVTSSSQ
jgi:hypothetical protein